MLLIAVFPTATQDLDPRNYYPEGCEPGKNEWMHAPLAEEYAMTRLNQWRTRERLYPLKRNIDLDRIAAQQSNYISQFAPFTDTRFITYGDFEVWHNDYLGQGIRERLARNGWPAFDNGVVIGTEIAAYYPDVSGAFNFWLNSPPHNEAATTRGFREVGLSVICWRGWLLSYVVMASQPETVAVTYDPYTNSLFLTDESRTYNDFNPGFKPQFFQIYDTLGNRLHFEEWLIWDSSVQLPPNAPDDIRLRFTDGVSMLTTDVNLERDRTFPSMPTPTPTYTPTFTPSPTVGPSPTLFVPTITPTPTTTPVPRSSEGYDIVLYYNLDYVSLVNESGRILNLEPLSVRENTPPHFQYQ